MNSELFRSSFNCTKQYKSNITFKKHNFLNEKMKGQLRVPENEATSIIGARLRCMGPNMKDR